ncbi:MAG: peptidoglycan DD-metalloendopeptidase family protein [Rudaea sp.]
MPIRIFLLLAMLASFRATAQTSDAQHAAQEAQAKQKLEQVRAEIHKITEAEKQTSEQRGDAANALRAQDLKVAAASKELRSLDQQLGVQQSKLSKLQNARDALDAKLKDQQDALAALVRSAYSMGRGEELKLLLAQDRIDDVGRMLAYYHYFEKARVGEIDGLMKDLDALAQVQNAIEKEAADLQSTRDQRSAQSKQLDEERQHRSRVLDELDATLKDQHSRLAALGKDEKVMLDLIAKLRDIFADIPKQLAGAEPFAQLRGRLSWPIRGQIMSRFGSRETGEQTSAGMLIAAKEGSEVHAISHGRVVYADWLRGYGLLLIVDHGDGYLSLYGYNEALLKDVGDWVDPGETVATSGDSGGRKTAGLYFEMRYQGKAIDPNGWLKSSSR